MVEKWITDMVMTVLLLLLMAYSLVGEVLHEWMGSLYWHCLFSTIFGMEPGIKALDEAGRLRIEQSRQH